MSDITPEEMAEIKKISDAMGKTEEEVLAEIEGVADSSYPLAAKIAIYKSENKNALSGIKGIFHLIPLSIGHLRSVEKGDKSLEVIDIIGFCNPNQDNNFELMQISLWNNGKVNRCLLASDLERDTIYTFDGSYNPATGKMSMVGEAFNPVDSEFDLLEALIGTPAIGPESLADNMGRPVFIKGYCGRVVNSEDGSYRGIEIASLQSDPIMVWLPDEFGTIDEAEWKGRSVIALGFGSQKEGKEPQFNARRAWTL